MQNPRYDEGPRVSVDEIDPGVWFVVDQDGEPVREYGIDPGPWSVKADADHQYALLIEHENEDMADAQIARVEWERLYG